MRRLYHRGCSVLSDETSSGIAKVHVIVASMAVSSSTMGQAHEKYADSLLGLDTETGHHLIADPRLLFQPNAGRQPFGYDDAKGKVGLTDAKGSLAVSTLESQGQWRLLCR